MEILKEKIKSIIKDYIEKYLPDCKDEEFEEKGTVYYMNGDDGTAFDWKMNGRLCEFMVFYEKSKKGAIKLNLKRNGSATIYVYANEGEDLVKEESFDLCTKDEAFSLAILLFGIADKKKKYDSNIDKLDFTHKITEKEKEELLSGDKESTPEEKEAKKPQVQKQVASEEQKVDKPKAASKAQGKKIYQQPKFWIITGVAVALVAIIAVVAIVLYNDQHKKAVARYAEAWENYANAQNDFGFNFGVLMGEMGFSMDEGDDYQLDETTIYDLSKECARETGIYDEIYNNPFVIEDENIAEKSLSHILSAVDTLTINAGKINEAKDLVEQCREVAQAKKDEIDKKKAEERAKAEEEAEKERKKQEAQAAYQRNVLTYDKFNSQIKEGMSLNAVKEIYGGFDDQCKVASQSGGYVIYSCTPGYHTSDYWAASFTFYNNVLRSKAQTGLD